MKVVALQLGLTMLVSPAVAEGTTCAQVKSIYRDNECCADTKDKKVAGLGYAPKEGPLSGTMPGMDHPKLLFGVDVDYPPYAYLKTAPYDGPQDIEEVSGVGPDMIKAMGRHCGFEAHVVQAHWSDCWGDGEIGAGLLQGWYHGCMTYTHASGVRNRYMEFSDAWAKLNKPAGLLVKLNDGVPTIKGADDLNGKKIVDVVGWAPTPETMYFIKNECTGQKYTGFEIVKSSDITLSADSAAKSKGENDKALLAMLDGQVDGVYLYGDQAANYQCESGATKDTKAGWNCELWSGFGTTFAYAQSGMKEWMRNGTTISMSKMGSGVGPFLDQCFHSFQKTKEYYNVCKTEHGEPPHSQINTCIPNEYFNGDSHFKPETIDKSPYMFATKDHKTGCSTGYCPC